MSDEFDLRQSAKRDTWEERAHMRPPNPDDEEARLEAEERQRELEELQDDGEGYEPEGSFMLVDDEDCSPRGGYLDDLDAEDRYPTFGADE